MEITHSDIQQILKIIDAAEHLNEIEIVHGGFRLHVVRNGCGKVVAANAEAANSPVLDQALPISTRPLEATAPAPVSETATPDGVVAIRAPMLGTFYRTPAPGEPLFVEVGQRVRADDTVCLIEVMKLFNSIRAGVDGEVVRILVENGSLVEYEQPLIFVAPD